MAQDRKQQIALMRYDAITPVMTGTAGDYSSLREYFRETSAKGLPAPDGRLRHYKRHRLIHPHYFCGVYDGRKNDKLWQEGYDYLDETYALTKGKKVCLNADGGSWIQGAKKRLHGLTQVLDEFHRNSSYDRRPSGQCLQCRT